MSPRLFALFTAVLLALPLTATALNLEQVGQRLNHAPIIQADFEQTQHLKLLSKPLQASGSLLLVRGKGLLWTVKSPFQSDIKLIGGHLYSNGQSSALPGGEQFANQLMDALAGNIDALKPRFHIQADQQGNQWRLVLTPRDDALARVIRKLTLGGDRSPHYFRIDYPNGDYSLTRLTHIRYPAHLSAAQEQRFAAPD